MKMLRLFLLLLTIFLGTTNPQSFYYELSYDVPGYPSSQGQYLGRPSHQNGQYDHFRNQGGHYHHKGHGGRYYNDNYHHHHKPSKSYENKKYNNFGYVSDSSFGESAPSSIKRNFGYTWRGEDFGRHWESSTKYPPGHPWHNPNVPYEDGKNRGFTKYPYGHPLHNHPPGHPWHNPNIPYDEDQGVEDEKELQENVPDPSMFPFGERVTPKPMHQPSIDTWKAPQTTSKRPQFEDIPQTTLEMQKSTSTGHPLNSLKDQTTSRKPNLEDLEEQSTTGQPWHEIERQKYLTTNKPRSTPNFGDDPVFQTSGTSFGTIGNRKRLSFKDVLTEEEILTIQREIENPSLESDTCIVAMEKLLKLYKKEELIPQGEDISKYPADVLRKIICQTGSSILKGQITNMLNNSEQFGQSSTEGTKDDTTTTKESTISPTIAPMSTNGIIFTPTLQPSTSTTANKNSSLVNNFVTPGTNFVPQTTPTVEKTSTGATRGPTFASSGTRSPPTTSTNSPETPSMVNNFRPSDPETTAPTPVFTSGTRLPSTMSTIGQTIPPLWVSQNSPELPKEVLYVSNDLYKSQEKGSTLYLSKNVPKGTTSPSVNIVPIISTDSGQKSGGSLVKINPPVIFIYHGENGESKIDIPVIPNDQEISFKFADGLLDVAGQKLTSKNPMLIINHNFDVREDQRSKDILFIQDLLSKLGGKNDLPTFRLDQLPANVQIIEDKVKVEELKRLLNVPGREFGNSGLQIATSSKVNPLTPSKFQSTVLEIATDSTIAPDPIQVVDVSKDIISVLNSGVLQQIQIPPGALDHPQAIQKFKNEIKGKILEGLKNLQNTNQPSKNLQIQETTITGSKTSPKRGRGRYRNRISRPRRQIMEKNVPKDITSVFNINDLLPKGQSVENYSPKALKSIQKEIGTYILEGVSDYVRKNSRTSTRSKKSFLLSGITQKNFIEPFRRKREIETHFELPPEIFLKSHVSKNGRALTFGNYQDLGAFVRKIRDLDERPKLPDYVHDAIHDIFHSKEEEKMDDVTISKCDSLVRAGNQKCGDEFSYIPEDHNVGGFHPGKASYLKQQNYRKTPSYNIAALLPGENLHLYPQYVLDAIQKDIGGAIQRGQQKQQAYENFHTSNIQNYQQFGNNAPNFSTNLGQKRKKGPAFQDSLPISPNFKGSSKHNSLLVSSLGQNSDSGFENSLNPTEVDVSGFLRFKEQTLQVSTSSEEDEKPIFSE